MAVTHALDGPTVTGEGSSDGSLSTESAAAASGHGTLVRTHSRLAISEVSNPGAWEQAKIIWNKEKEGFKKMKRTYTVFDWFAHFLPCLVWLRTYKLKEYLYRDVLAGLSVAAMVVPQGMSYAQNLAYLPQVFGLYGDFVPNIIYSLLGSSRQLVVGPVAVTSLLLGNGLSNIFGNFDINPSAPQDALEAALQEEYNHAAIQIAFLAGCMYTMIGILRMGWITNILSAPVISGFMTGAACIIGSGQLKYLTGQKLPRSDNLLKNLELVFEDLTAKNIAGEPLPSAFRWREFVMGTCFLVILFAFKYGGQAAGRSKNRWVSMLWALQVLGPLTVVVISIAIMNIWKLYIVNPLDPETPLIKEVGYIPSGLPPVTISWWFPLYFPGKQILLAVIVCLLDICESISIAKSLARKNKYRLDGTQELRGLGIANIVGSMCSAYTTTGSFSRSAVNNAVGARTQLSGFVTGVTVMLVLLCLTPIFTHMSANVQGAIVIYGVFSIADFGELLYLVRVSLLDSFNWVAAFLLTAFLGVEIGIGAAVGISLLTFIYKSAFPKISLVGRLPGTDIYRSRRLFPKAEPAGEGIIIIQVNAPIYFANTEHLSDYTEEVLEAERDAGGGATDAVRAIILDLGPVFDVDSSGSHFLDDYADTLARADIALVLANPQQNVILMLHRAGIVDKLGTQAVHVNLADAVAYAKELVRPEAAAKSV